MLTALIPVGVASVLVRVFMPALPFLPNWLTNVVKGICWALIGAMLVYVWGWLLWLVGCLNWEQLKRFPFRQWL